MSKDAFESTTSILARAADKAVPKDRPCVAATKRKPRGYKLRDENPRKNYRTLLTDAQVLECRSKYEFETGWTPRALAAVYGVTGAYMSRLLGYDVRSKLIPKRPR